MILSVAPGTKVYLGCRPVDMRKGFDGLAAVVATVLKKDPYSGHMFLFRGKKGGYLKVLYYDGSGLCLSPSGWSEGSSSGQRSSMPP